MALDAAGNQSAASNEFDVAWDSSGIGVDTEAPNAPASLNAPAATNGTVDLTWIPSADNVGRHRLRIYRDGALVKTVKTTSTTDLGLAAGKAYEYYIVAIDAAGNVSRAATWSRRRRRAARRGRCGGKNGLARAAPQPGRRPPSPHCDKAAAGERGYLRRSRESQT